MAISTPNRATNGAPQTSAGIPRDLPQYVQDVVRRPGRLLIHGEWVEATTAKTFETFDPATEESPGRVAHGMAHDVDLAVGAARRALTTSALTGAG